MTIQDLLNALHNLGVEDVIIDVQDGEIILATGMAFGNGNEILPHPDVYGHKNNA